MYGSIYFFLNPMGKDMIAMLNHAGVTGISLYLTPTSWVLHLGLLLLNLRKQNLVETVIAVMTCRCIMQLTGDMGE